MKRGREGLNNPGELRQVRQQAAQAQQARLNVIRVAIETLLARGIPDSLLPQILMQVYDPDEVWIVLQQLGLVA